MMRLDLLLTATQLVELVSEGVAKLKAAGIDTMMPANWKLEPQRMADGLLGKVGAHRRGRAATKYQIRLRADRGLLLEPGSR